MKKRLLSLTALALSLMMVLSACGGSGNSAGSSAAPGTDPAASGTAAEGSAPDQKIIWAIHNEADTLDPGITNNTFASPVLMNTFEGLMTYDNNNNLVPGVAADYKVSEDGTQYTFTLRDGLKWSDGSALTAEDFIYSWTRVITPETGGKFSGLITDYVLNAQEFFDGTAKIEEVGFKAQDEKTIVITTKAPTPWFLDILVTYTWSPVKKAAVEASPDAWAKNAETFICNGPFKPSAITVGEGYVLVKNDEYYAADSVKLQEINMRLIPDQATALTAFESGEIDGFYEVPSDDIPRLKSESDEMYSVSQFAHTYYIMNLESGPLKDARVRKALALALDRTQLIENVLQTADKPATGLVSPGYMVDGKDYTDGRPDYGIAPTANVEEAKKLLAEAGYPDGKDFPKLRLSYYTNPIVKKVTEAMQQMWKENLGIEMEISTEEWKVYYDNVQAHNYDIAAMGWGADYLHPASFFETMLSTSVNNNSQYANEAYDALIRETMGTVDAAKGRDLMLKAEQILIGDDMAVIPLYYRSRVLMMSDSVDGWLLTPLNNMYFKNAEEIAA
ncbi:peptide ABC transporter substrate-binding protein [Oscillospiraceae bacterium MB08-C2-2]|nr:peptide ABC transporter substrate-binding protein [Oscillospiraceae bacterium MB08-C2-2]